MRQPMIHALEGAFLDFQHCQQYPHHTSFIDLRAPALQCLHVANNY